MNKEAKQLHDKAWKELDKLGAKLGQRMMIRSAFAAMNKDEFPFIKEHYENRGSKFEKKYYCSTISGIDNMLFETELEANLANSLYVMLNKKVSSIDEFNMIFKATLRLLRYDSDWNN